MSEDKYVGSATDFERRFANHYSSIRDLYDNSNKGAKFHKTLFTNGIDNYSFTVVKNTTNYYYDFMKEWYKDGTFNNDSKLFHVLQQFTQYEARMYEQAIIHAVEPSLNVGQEVSFNINWDSSKEFIDNRNTTPIQAITRYTDKVYDFPSIRKAALLLDIDKRNIQTSLNYMTYHKSDVLGEYVRFIDNTKPIYNVGVHNKDHLPLFEQIDYTSIPEKRDENFNKVGVKLQIILRLLEVLLRTI